MSVHNDASYLNEAVQSMLAQTLEDLELIVVDAGSTDGTAKVLGDICDPRLRVISTTRISLPSALNLALDHARGVYVARMDGDDISHPDRLRRQVEFLEQHPTIGYLGAGLSTMDESGKHIRDYIYPSEPSEIRRLVDRMSFALPHNALLFRMEVLKAVGGYDPFFLKAEDYDLHLRLTEEVDASNLSESLIKYRIRMNSLSATGNVLQLQYELCARVLAGIRRGDIPNPKGLQKADIFQILAGWMVQEQLCMVDAAATDRRQAWIEYSHGRFARALLAASRAFIRNPSAALRYFSSQRDSVWNEKRQRSVCEMLSNCRHPAPVQV